MTYDKAIELAVDSARAVAELLRDELHHTDGRRTTPGSSSVLEAERLVSVRLTSASSWPLPGREAGVSASGGGHVWCVDVDDGGASSRSHPRGPAISIALLRDSTPVLGVVHAFLHPDDRGDLLCWAEGCGPILRNGARVVPERTTLRSDAQVLLAPDAEATPELYAPCVAPARFITIPSLAYRLALAAVGEGTAAVSLDATSPRRLAAGHALLRGARKVLLDERGDPVRYLDGRASIERCFGGDEEACRELSGRRWDPVPARSAARAAPPLLERTGAIRDSERLARAQGVLLGQLAGDALGSLVEFESAKEIARRHPEGVRELVDGGTWNTLAGQPTDDSEMALVLARSLVEMGRYDEAAVAAAYVRWFESKPFDMGNTTRTALLAARRGERAMSDSQANGSLMRISPIGVFAAGRPALAAALARQDSGITHPHAVCRTACAAFSAAIAEGIGGADAARMWEVALEHGDEPSVRNVLEAARERAPADCSTNMGWVLIALQNAFFELLHAPTLEAGVVRTVMRGGDTDTNAAIAGALLGAAHGRGAVPGQWLRALLSCRPLRESGAVHPRPRELWPVDVLPLAERLLSAGERA